MERHGFGVVAEPSTGSSTDRSGRAPLSSYERAHRSREGAAQRQQSESSRRGDHELRSLITHRSRIQIPPPPPTGSNRAWTRSTPGASFVAEREAESAVERRPLGSVGGVEEADEPVRLEDGVVDFGFGQR